MCREQKQGTSHAPCTKHHKEVGKTLDTPTPSPHARHQLTRPQGASNGTCYLSSLPLATTGTPIKCCLNVLAWPHQFLLTGEGQEPWSVSLPLWKLLSSYLPKLSKYIFYNWRCVLNSTRMCVPETHTLKCSPWHHL